MHKFLTLISIILLFLFFTPVQLKAQVVTEIDSITMCYNALKSVPIVLHNMNGVDKLKLALAYDMNAIEYVESFGVNEALAGGNLIVTPDNDSLIITWSRASSVTIAEDTLVWLRFKGQSGSTVFHWNTTTCYYHTSGGNQPAVFVDGKAVVDPKINVILTELTPTCPKTCAANYQAEASGGIAPYSYLWNGKPSQYDFIRKYLCAGNNQIRVTDAWVVNSTACIL